MLLRSLLFLLSLAVVRPAAGQWKTVETRSLKGAEILVWAMDKLLRF